MRLNTDIFYLTMLSVVWNVTSYFFSICCYSSPDEMTANGVYIKRRRFNSTSLSTVDK